MSFSGAVPPIMNMKDEKLRGKSFGLVHCFKWRKPKDCLLHDSLSVSGGADQASVSFPSRTLTAKLPRRSAEEAPTETV